MDHPSVYGCLWVFMGVYAAQGIKSMLNYTFSNKTCNRDLSVTVDVSDKCQNVALRLTILKDYVVVFFLKD